MKVENVNTPCKRPSRDSSLLEKAKYARQQRENKLFKYSEIQENWPTRFIRANLGQNHPDFGMSPQEHAKNKS